MKKPLPLFFLLLCLFSDINAQRQQFIDSLKQDLKTVTDDSLRFRLLDELAWTYKRIDADSALMFGMEGLAISEKLELRLKGIVLATIGVTKYENGISGFGVEELKEALLISQQLEIERRVASNYTNLGNAFENSGQYDSSIHYSIQAIELKLSLGDSGSAASTMSNISLVYNEIGDVDKAIDFVTEALEIVGPESRRNRGMYNNLGIFQMQKEQYQEARTSFFKTLRGTEKSRNQRNYATTYGNIGIAHLREKNYDSAIYYTEESLQLKRATGQRLGMSHPAITLAEAYLELDQLSKAKEYAELALEVSEESGSLERRAESLKILAKIETKQRRFEAANEHLVEYYNLDDSLKSKAVLRASQDAEARFQNKLKEQENQLLRTEASSQAQVIKNQNTLVIASIVISLLLLAIALLLRKQLKERKLLLGKIELQADKLRELDQAKTRFFSNISHDLRSPLTLILGALDTINTRDHEILDNESKELLDVGYKNGKRLLYLADEIMDLTRLEEGKVALEIQQVKVVPYLRLLTKMFSSAADIKLIELKFNTDEDEDLVLGLDPHHFEKIIYNLLSNAIKFTPEKGEVKVELRSDSDTIYIDVADSGTGIPPESIKHIFDRYYQSPTDAFRSQTGVGIGLALVKELVELHHGTINVESDELGTRFHIKLPYERSSNITKAIVPERSLDVISKNSLWVDLQEEKEKLQVPSLTNLDENAKSILIVEDHKELRSYLKSLLATHYKVSLAANGASALDILQAGNIDLILTDLMMPYMDGFELIDHLKKDKDLKKIPVLVVSARTDKTEKLDLLDKGAKDVISKPFDKEELLVRIKNAMEKDWDATKKLSSLYGETAQEFEKNIMARLERLILKRIDDQHLSVLDLADEMAASERKVYRMIKKISGLTPFELIKEIRWQYLDNYLKNNNVKNATEAAQLIGMNNVSSFTEQYKKRFGKAIQEVIN